MKSKLTVLMLLFSGVVLGGCQKADSAAETPAATPAPIDRAIAIITPTDGNQVKGMVDFIQNNDTVDITVRLEGLEPNSVHGWHIHEFGDISAPDGTATGGHYNPEEHDHALPNADPRHAGDLGNLTADAQGRATQELSVQNVSINGQLNPILGRGVIIHAEEDDGGQPTGNAGGRIGQGVIGVRQVSQPAS